MGKSCWRLETLEFWAWKQWSQRPHRQHQRATIYERNQGFCWLRLLARYQTRCVNWRKLKRSPIWLVRCRFAPRLHSPRSRPNHSCCKKTFLRLRAYCWTQITGTGLFVWNNSPCNCYGGCLLVFILKKRYYSWRRTSAWNASQSPQMLSACRWIVRIHLCLERIYPRVGLPLVRFWPLAISLGKSSWKG